jgi:spermidine synthase
MISSKRREVSPGFNLLLIVFAVGFLGISLELMIIYSYQILTGYVYQQIGFLIALFMLGLPLGAQMAKGITQRFSPSGKGRISSLTAASCGLGVMALIIPGLLSTSLPGPITRTFVYLMAIGAGFFVGAVFALALGIYRQNRLVRAAGMVDAADHLGAAVGAFFTGALLVPVLGLSATGWILFFLAIFAPIPLIISKKHQNLTD